MLHARLGITAHCLLPIPARASLAISLVHMGTVTLPIVHRALLATTAQLGALHPHSVRRAPSGIWGERRDNLLIVQRALVEITALRVV